MAAVLACGHGASLSHSSAAQARGFMPGTNVWVDVTVPTPGRRARTGIIVHTTRSLMPADVGAVDRIPCTSPSRTLVDLAGTVELRPLRRAVERADSLGVLDLWLIRETLGRLPAVTATGVWGRSWPPMPAHPALAVSSSSDSWS